MLDTIFLIVFLLTFTVCFLAVCIYLYYIIKALVSKKEAERQRLKSESRKEARRKYWERHPKFINALKLISRPFVVTYLIGKGVWEVLESILDSIGNLIIAAIILFIIFALLFGFLGWVFQNINEILSFIFGLIILFFILVSIGSK